MNTEREKRIGVIGCGLRATDVFKHIPELGGRIKIEALYDTSMKAMETFRNIYDRRAKCCNNWESVINDETIDWIFVMSPNNFHKEQILAAIGAGKNIFSEKPLAVTSQECIEVKEAYQNSTVEFVMGFTLRYSPHYRKIRQLIDEGRVGDIISMEFNETLDFNHGGYIHADWRRSTRDSGGHLLEKCCHDIDVASLMVRSRVARVASFGGNNFFVPKNEPYIEKLGKNDEGRNAYCTAWGDDNETPINPFVADGDIVDNQVAIIEYENGTRATFHTNCNAGIPERRMYILGTEGAIRADVIQGIIETKRIGFNEVMHDESAGVSGGHGGGDYVLGPELFDCIVNGAPSKSTFKDGYTSAMIAFAIEEARQSQTVVEM